MVITQYKLISSIAKKKQLNNYIRMKSNETFCNTLQDKKHR